MSKRRILGPLDVLRSLGLEVEVHSIPRTSAEAGTNQTRGAETMELNGLERELALLLYYQQAHASGAEPGKVPPPRNVKLEGDGMDAEGYDDRELIFENRNGRLATFQFELESWLED